MAEISVQFSNKLNGYDKVEVSEYVKQAESKLQEKSIALAHAQQQIEELEARLAKITSADSTVEEKVELYDKLMKKMDGDYTRLLAPAVAKAKAIEAQAEKEYAIRMDQARYAAEGIYVETADRITNVVDANMEKLYDRINELIYSKSAMGRLTAFGKGCKVVAIKIKGVPVKTAKKVKASALKIKEKQDARKAAKAAKKAAAAPVVAEEPVVEAVAE